MTTVTRLRHPIAVLTATLLIAALVPTFTGPAEAAPSDAGCDNRNINDQVEKFLACVDAEDAFEHLAAFQSFADDNGDTRASGTPGYDLSADYVADLLTDAGYEVERQEFDFPFFEETSTTLTVDGQDIETGAYTFSGPGTVPSEGATANVVNVDLALEPPRASTAGCEPSDFDGLDFSGDNDIALIQRGACTFFAKALNAQQAGAEAVIIFNQGNDEGRLGLIVGTLGGTAAGLIDIPVVGADFATGELLATTDATVTLDVDATSEIRTTENVIADLEGVNADNVVMAGAHLDSVAAGPGIQDNGSGSAAILSIALAMGNNRKFTPENTVRFAWWGAEELGLVGSFEYFTNDDFGLTQDEIDEIALYLNFDMIASPNYIYGVYDADTSTFPAPIGIPIPDGSEELEDLFEAYFTVNDVPYEDTQFSGRSDYQAFILSGIPASGLFTGAEVIKSPEQEAIWGGTAGEQFDQCYHEACDTLDNVSFEALEVNIDAVADAVFRVALSTEAINGVEGREVRGPSVTELDGPQGTFLDGGGGLAPDHDHSHGDED